MQWSRQRDVGAPFQVKRHDDVLTNLTELQLRRRQKIQIISALLVKSVSLLASCEAFGLFSSPPELDFWSAGLFLHPLKDGKRG